ncbi:hypothetical protein WICPIJ_003736 [Wickerhamomyces pijperi]|uniref:Uncharacterized protein n=1 Tax=Wickerhamomyces pijperi TaxID=599730 RepID=A0A9P8Q6I8_WICPI|nr:hypothetical protein WICPIJ_003736 [Wickerhamomyces pijperi]
MEVSSLIINDALNHQKIEDDEYSPQSAKKQRDQTKVVETHLKITTDFTAQAISGEAETYHIYTMDKMCYNYVPTTTDQLYAGRLLSHCELTDFLTRADSDHNLVSFINLETINLLLTPPDITLLVQ